MPGIKGLWSLRASDSSLFDQYLVQSYIGETRVLSIDGEEMGEVRDVLTARSALRGPDTLVVI
jgi:DNA damage-binding protein 1